MAIIARLIIRPHKPGEGIIQARFMNVKRRNGDTQTRSRPAIGLLQIGAPRLFQTLNLAGWIRQADFGELRVNRAPAAFKYAEDVCWWNDMPCRQRIHRR